MLPDENQVTYTIFKPSDIDGTIVDLATESAGQDVSLDYFSNFSTQDGTPVVASQSELGSVLAVESTDSLENMLQVQLTPRSVKNLNSGGILWFEKKDSRTLWTLSSDEQEAQSIIFKGASYQLVPWPWENSAKAVVLNSSVTKLGLVNDYKTLVVTGMSEDESLELADSLLEVGIDPAIIEYHKKGDAYSETPLQIGITGIMFLMACILILSSTRSIVSSLKMQSRELVSLGVPNSWLAKVFLTELALTVGVGLFLGVLLTVFATALALSTFNVATSVPWLVIAGYGSLIVLLVTFVSWSGLRRIRA
jgi:hypothetical protein